MWNRIKVLNKSDVKGLSDLEILKIGTDMHIEANYATPKLFSKIEKSINDYGPYFIFDNGISVAHSEPGDHCHKLGASLLVIKDGVKVFGKNVKIFVTLSVPKDGDHMELLQKVIKLVGDAHNQEEILGYTKANEK